MGIEALERGERGGQRSLAWNRMRGNWSGYTSRGVRSSGGLSIPARRRQSSLLSTVAGAYGSEPPRVTAKSDILIASTCSHSTMCHRSTTEYDR
jgi:hypothetical protein